MPLTSTTMKWEIFLPTMQIWNGTLVCLGIAQPVSTMLRADQSLVGEQETPSGLQITQTTFQLY